MKRVHKNAANLASSWRHILKIWQQGEERRCQQPIIPICLLSFCFWVLRSPFCFLQQNLIFLLTESPWSIFAAGHERRDSRSSRDFLPLCHLGAIGKGRKCCFYGLQHRLQWKYVELMFKLWEEFSRDLNILHFDLFLGSLLGLQHVSSPSDLIQLVPRTPNINKNPPRHWGGKLWSSILEPTLWFLGKDRDISGWLVMTTEAKNDLNTVRWTSKKISTRCCSNRSQSHIKPGGLYFNIVYPI
jgi:hypothetical protein